MEIEEVESLSELLQALDEREIYDYQRYRSVKRFITFRAKEKGVPVSGSFELTPLCNLDCNMCYVHLKKEQLKCAKLLSVKEWKRIMGEAIARGMMYASLTGGECLTYPGFRELFQFLRNQGIEVAVLTNGVLLTESMTEFFRRNPPVAIQVTLYGSNGEAYERVTGGRSFNQVMEGIRRVKEAGIPLSLAVTPNCYMRDDAEPLIRMAESLKTPYSINAGLAAPREETGRRLGKQDAEIAAYIKMREIQAVLQGKELYRKYEMEIPEPGGSSDTSGIGIRCGAGRMSFSVRWNGQMCACNVLKGETAQPLQEGFSAAWRKIHLWAKAYRRPAECNGCHYEAVCKGCAAEHEGTAPHGHANPAVCKWVQQMVCEGILRIGI